MKAGRVFVVLAAAGLAACASKAPRTIIAAQGVHIVQPADIHAVRQAKLGDVVYRETAEIEVGAASIRDPLPTNVKGQIWPVGTLLEKVERGKHTEYCKSVLPGSGHPAVPPGFHCYRDSDEDGRLDVYVFGRIVKPKKDDPPAWLALASPGLYLAKAMASGAGKVLDRPVKMPPVAFDAATAVHGNAVLPPQERLVQLTSLTDSHIGLTYRTGELGEKKYTGRPVYRYNQSYRFLWNDNMAEVKIGSLEMQATRVDDKTVQFMVQSGFKPWAAFDARKSAITVTPAPDKALCTGFFSAHTGGPAVSTNCGYEK